jgi:hypothetical protein
MRKLILIMVVTIFSVNCLAQNDKIPFKVDFKEDLIVITIPYPYNTPDIRPVAVPGFIFSMQTRQIQPFSPSKSELIEILEKKLATYPDELNNVELHDFLTNIVLYLYLGNNNSTNLSKEARQLLEKWNQQNLTLKNEIGLVNQYIKFADKITQELLK